MSHRPWPIVIIALFHILAPLINLVMSAALVGLPIADYLHMQMRLNMNFLTLWVFLPLAAGLALLTFRMWSYYLFLAFMAMVSLYTFRQRWLYPHHVNIWLFTFLELINFSVILYFWSPAVRRIYLNKRIRWWQQRPRFLITADAKLDIGGQIYSAKIENISEGGAFVACSADIQNKKEAHLKFEMAGHKIGVKALVLHHRGGGYGLFFHDSPAVQKEIRALTKALLAQGVHVRGREMTTKENFLFWFKDLLGHGHGVFPEDPTHPRHPPKAH